MPASVRIDRQKLRSEISLKIGKDNDVLIRTKKFAEEVRDYWRDVAWPTSVGNHGPGVHPYDTGAYAASIQVARNRGGLGRFIAGFKVFSDSPHANFIEFGTGPDKPGSRSPWGPFTPTPAFAPAGKTALFFDGTSP